MAILYVTADWKRFVPEGDPDAAFVVSPSDIDARGLRDAYDEFIRPKADPPKQAKRPADKMLRAHSDK